MKELADGPTKFLLVLLIGLLVLCLMIYATDVLCPSPSGPSRPERPQSQPTTGGVTPGRQRSLQTPSVVVAAGNRRLFDAIRQIESGGNDSAVGDGGRSVGPYQCGLLAWLDGGGKREDYPRLAYDRAATERIMVRYWERYGAATDEAKARTWNGGPRGMNKKATLAYWTKVRKEMQ